MSKYRKGSSLITLVKSYRAEVEKINSDLYIPHENKNELIQQKRAEFSQKLAQDQAAAKSSFDGIRSQLKAQMDSRYLPAGDAQAGIAADEQTWRRAQSMLNNDVSPTAIVNDAVQRGDKRMIQVMQNEYRYHAAANSGSFNDVDHLDKLVSQAKIQTGSPDYQAFSAEIDELDRAAYEYEMSSRQAENELDPYSDCARPMLDDNGQVVDMSTD